MATFQSEYEEDTDTIDNILRTQLSSVLDWTNIPGGLQKVVSSSIGYAWGYNADNSVWSCQLPCSGNWQMSDLRSYSIGKVLDIAADQANVYVLYTSVAGITRMLVTPANRQGVWNSITLPMAATKIFSTHTYIWAQDPSNNKIMCPKPCTSPNWLNSSENSIEITSSTDSNLYGKDPIGTPMQTDETMHSGWSPITVFAGSKVESVIGGNMSNIYALDEASNTLKYDGKNVTQISTAGYSPTNITSGNNQLWMTTDTPGAKGNVFTRLDNPDYAGVVNMVSPLDKKRDELVDKIESKFNQQTDVMTVNKQSKEIIDFFKKIFNIDKDTAKKANTQMGHINEQIRSTQRQLDMMAFTEKLLQVLIVTLILVVINYAIFASHLLAVAIVGGGIYFILTIN